MTHVISHSQNLVNPEKYVVFKREQFYNLMGELALPPYSDGVETVGQDLDCAVLVEDILNRVRQTELKDAVVIRRQDKFASPCLLTYALMIQMVADHHPELIAKEELSAIADYFHEQGVLAGEEGYKLPTL